MAKFVVQFLEDREGYEDEDEDEETYDFELSVVRTDHHGYDYSWGWYDDSKICLLHGGVGGGEYSKETIERIKKYAQLLCDELNSEREDVRRNP